MSKTPIVAIVGRPNVGKSSLFNAVIGSKKAIVSDIAGTTRDSVMHRVEGGMVDYWLVDTAGLTNVKGETLEEEVQLQVKLSLDHADMVVFVIDSKKEPTLDDQDVAHLLRKSKKPILFIANKVDDGQPFQAMEWSNLGFGIPQTVSAKNNTNIWEVLESIEDKLVAAKFKREEEPLPGEKINVALLGRPNVGKSSMFNTLLGQKRSVVSDVSGTTRDAIDSEFRDSEGQEYVFVDTAGLRKRGKQKDMEFWSGVRTVKSIEQADICIVLIDALDGVTHQDLVIIGKVLEAGKGLIIAVNKYDLMREKTLGEETDDRELDEVEMWGEDLDKVRERYLAYLSKKIPFCPWAPVVFCSAKSGKGVNNLLPSCKAIFTERQRRISTGQLNRILPDIQYGHVTPSVGNKTGKMKYITQAETMPPTFILFVNNKEAFHFSYRRYVENKLREEYGFHGTPIKIQVRDARGDRDEKKGRGKRK